jgi:hypothetical protein
MPVHFTGRSQKKIDMPAGYRRLMQERIYDFKVYIRAPDLVCCMVRISTTMNKLEIFCE